MVPTMGALYLVVTLLYPFVVIRTVSAEKQSGALKLLLQLPYSTAALLAAKLIAAVDRLGRPAAAELDCGSVFGLQAGGHLQRD